VSQVAPRAIDTGNAVPLPATQPRGPSTKRVPGMLDALRGLPWKRLTVVAAKPRTGLSRIEQALSRPSRRDTALAAFCRDRGVAVVETGPLDSAEAASCLRALTPDLGILLDGPVPARALTGLFRLGVLSAGAGMMPLTNGDPEWALAGGDAVGCSVALVNDDRLLARRAVESFGSASIDGLRNAVEREALGLLRQVMQGVLVSGALPAIQTPAETPGPRHFAMHPELTAALNRRLGADSL